MPRGQLDSVLRHMRRVAGLSAAHQELTDADLLGRYLSGRDEDAFATLVRRYGRLVRSVCRHVLHHEQDVDDTFQATFLVFASKAASIRKTTSVASWLYGVAYRTAMNAKRARMHRREEQREIEVCSKEQPVAEAALREVQAILDDEVNHLPEKYRTPFVLCCLEGKSRAEAARQLGWKEGTVFSRLARARKELQKRLSRRGVVLSAALCAVEVSRTVATAAVPQALVNSTIQAALSFASGKAAAVGSAQAVALAKGVIQAMLLTKLKAAVPVLVALSLLAASAGLAAHHLAGPEQAAPQSAALEPAPKGAEQLAASPEKQARTDRYGDPLPDGAIARVGTTRLWHGSQFYALVYAPDGKAVAACSDPVIHVWDTASGKELRQFHGQQNGVTSLAISPNGKLLAAAGWGDLLIWRLDAASDKEIRRIPTANGGADAVVFSPDGEFLAAATKDHIIRVWEVDPWREVRQLPGHRGFCVGLAFFPDSKTLLSCNQDDSIRIWDTVKGRQLRIVADNLKNLCTMALSPDGKRLVTVQDFKTLRLWDVATGKELSRFTGPEDSCYCLAFSPDGRTLASGFREIRLWDTATGKERHQWGSSLAVTRLAFSPSGKTLAVGESGVLSFREAATGRDALPCPGPPHITTLTFAAGGKTLVTGSWGGVVGFWETATGKELSGLRNPPSGFSALPRVVIPLAVSHDGQRVAALDAQRLVWVWETATGKRLSRFGGQPGPSVGIPTLSPDGNIVAAAHADKTIRLWDAITGKQLRRLGPEYEPANMPFFSPDGKLLATTYPDSSIRVRETSKGKEVGHIHWSGGIAVCLAFSPDGKLLASGHLNADRERERPRRKEEETLIRIWDLARGREVRQIKGTWYAIWSVAFSPDGKTLVGGTHFSTIHLWEVATGKERRRFQGDRGSTNALAFTPDGRLLASGHDRTALVWDVTALLQEGKLRSLASSPTHMKRVWADLAGEDASKAFQAIWHLATLPRQTVPFLKERLRPAAIDRNKIAQTIADLDSNKFAVREKAAAELGNLGEIAEPALRKSLQGQPSLELRRRAEKLLEKVAGPVTAQDTVRDLRAVEVLEHIGTPEAREVLKSLANGASEARLTQEAKASLERLARRHAGAR